MAAMDITSAADHDGDPAWKTDILGEEFQALDLDLGVDPEGEGQAIATLVRHRPIPDPVWSQRPALLWIHGMTDYFFHDHVARHFTEQGYAFYAIDLRKCGRSRQEGQRWHYSTDLRHYFPDLTEATAQIAHAGHSGITPIGHSTGALVSALWADHVRRHASDTHQLLDGLILNGPWLDLQYPKWMVRILRPVVKFFGPKLPNVTIPGGNLGTYGQSIHSSKSGEWDYDTTMKPLGGHPKYLVWLNAILKGQERIHNNEVDVGVPLLTVCSSDSYLGASYSPAADAADVVIDVEQAQRWSRTLSDDVTVKPIDGARHDVYLSLPHALEEAFEVTDEWLNRNATK